MRGPSLLRSVPPLALAAALALGLSGCGGDTMTAFDATAYVRGVLDEIAAILAPLPDRFDRMAVLGEVHGAAMCGLDYMEGELSFWRGRCAA